MSEKEDDWVSVSACALRDKQGCPRLIFFGAITLPVFLNFNFGPSLRNVRGQRPEAGVTVMEP